MTPVELPPTTGNGTSPGHLPTTEETAQELRREVVELARTLPGDLRRLTVRSGSCAIEVEWGGGAGGPAPARGEAAAESVVAEGTTALAGATAVRAPLVGTFYVAPSPGADPFVRVGDQVEAGQTLGIVEAMKLMNPILADQAGVVAEILVGDTESVEYDQTLMLLLPPGAAP
ncbi:acetyl-CoA carboxylase biotin carboxyl carrier protein subunit [Geodermatophilus sp. TF02-6]|uniref:acetyl-CoA carboxylase biotin carboxyl carrier protein n=1 Tax=Geodermatophilus sp. TF02-6 TaxID=2250575 RepID=UPI000DEB3F83|nr:biotin/lipoyl-containing protein [Geodermatophilus sp. TF02-6]RBY75096.1 acetyl-CoA carboxylase biotin carboxyl carrier protein subunit [Geodermatophilus sp. TF02-6]